MSVVVERPCRIILRPFSRGWGALISVRDFMSLSCVRMKIGAMSRAWIEPKLLGSCGYGKTLTLSADAKLKLEAANQLKEHLENYTNGHLYANFLKKLMPILTTILKGQPVFVSTSAEQVCIMVAHGGVSGADGK